jgi:hypothetical protein
MPPSSTLIVIKGVLKRDPGTFSSWKDSHAVVSRDK